MSVFTKSHFQNADAARAYLEDLRWSNERVCPHCGSAGKSYATKRTGVYRCGEKECRKDFSVTTKTVMESSKVPLHLWLQAFYLMCSSKKGYSAHQLHRTIGVTYKTAWFMAHRIREAMRAGGLVPPMGGDGGIVEADETYYGKLETPRLHRTSGEPFLKRKRNRKRKNERPIISLVERGGSVRSFHVAVADKFTVNKIVTENIARETRLHTDERPPLWRCRLTLRGTRDGQATVAANTSVMMSTPIPRKAISASSSAVCAASISTARKNTCTAIWRSMTSDTTTVSGSDTQTPNV